MKNKYLIIILTITTILTIPQNTHAKTYQLDTTQETNLNNYYYVSTNPNKQSYFEIDEHNTTITKYSQYNTIDTTFGTNGTTTLRGDQYPLETGEDLRTYKAQEVENGIIVVSKSVLNDINSIAVTKLDTQGNRDTTFGTNGNTKLTMPEDGNIYLYNTIKPHIAIDNNENIVISIEANYGSYSKIALWRLTPEGNLDNTFSTDGHFSYEKREDGLTTKPNVDFLHIENDKILTGGFYLKEQDENRSNSTIIILRINSNGELDNTFGTNGVLEIQPQMNELTMLVERPEFLITPTSYYIFGSTFRYTIDKYTHILGCEIDKNGTLNDNISYYEYEQFTEPNEFIYPGFIFHITDNNLLITYTKVKEDFSSKTVLIQTEINNFITNNTLPENKFLIGNNSGEVIPSPEHFSQTKNFIGIQFSNLDLIDDRDGSNFFKLEEVYQIENNNNQLQILSSNKDIKKGSLFGIRNNSTIYIKDTSTNKILAEANTYLSSDKSWIEITAITEGNKTLIHGLYGAQGVLGTYTMYIPKGTNDNALGFCPGVTDIEDINTSCSNYKIFTEKDPELEITVIDGITYWKLSGVSGSGAFSTTNDSTTTYTPIYTQTIAEELEEIEDKELTTPKEQSPEELDNRNENVKQEQSETPAQDSINWLWLIPILLIILLVILSIQRSKDK